MTGEDGENTRFGECEGDGREGSGCFDDNIEYGGHVEARVAGNMGYNRWHYVSLIGTVDLCSIESVGLGPAVELEENLEYIGVRI